jgi:hypothetical protein
MMTRDIVDRLYDCDETAFRAAAREIKLLQFENKLLRFENERLRDELPKTADGVVVVPGMSVWRISQSGCTNHHEVLEITGRRSARISHHNTWPIDCCYSTREAAEAAKENSDEK